MGGGCFSPFNFKRLSNTDFSLEPACSELWYIQCLFLLGPWFLLFSGIIFNLKNLRILIMELDMRVG